MRSRPNQNVLYSLIKKKNKGGIKYFLVLIHNAVIDSLQLLSL
jgi:hypothetical protein